MISRLFRKLVFGGSTTFSNHEQACLSAFSDALPQSLRTVLAAQLSSVQTIQRFSSGQQVNVFLHSTVPRFPNQNEETRAAWIDVEFRNSKVRCHVIVHRGLLSSLEFNKAVPRSDELRVQAVRVVSDLSTSASARRLETYGHLLSALAKQISVEEVEAPASNDVVSSVLHEFELDQHSDLATLIRETDGFSFAGWRFLGTHLRSVSTSEGRLVVFAEQPRRQLIVRRQSNATRYCLYDPIDEVEVWQEGDLRIAIVRATEPS